MGLRPSAGFLGPFTAPTAAQAQPGVWSLRDHSLYRRAGTWPGNTTALLLNCNGSNGSTSFPDASANNRQITVNSVTVSTSVVKFGTGSATFNGSSSSLVVPDATSIELGNNNFVMEFWINTTSSTQYATLISREPATYGAGMWSLLMNNASSTAGDLAFYANEGGTPVVTTSGVSIRDGAWHHVACVRTGTTASIYVDGTRRGTTTTSNYTVLDIAGNVYIGRDQFYGRYFAGNLDDIRITIAWDRGYTGATITVPSAELTA